MKLSISFSSFSWILMYIDTVFLEIAFYPVNYLSETGRNRQTSECSQMRI